MNKYDPQKFVTALNQKSLSGQLVCPFCHGNQFTTTEDFASIILGKDLSSLNIGPSIPAGMVICQNCGHIDLFALGALGLLEKKEQSNGE